MEGVTFLPEKLRRAHEETRPHLPAHHVGPLVDQHGQVAIRADPFLIERTDDRLAGGPHSERLFELIVSSARHPGYFRGKAFDMLRLLHQVALRNEQREVHVLVPGRFDHRVEGVADVGPQRAHLRRMAGEQGVGLHVEAEARGGALGPRLRLLLGHGPVAVEGDLVLTPDLVLGGGGDRDVVVADFLK